MFVKFKNRNLYVMLTMDALAFAVALLFAYATRFNFALGADTWREYFGVLPWVVAVKTATFLLMGSYHGLWRYTSLADIWQLLKGSTLATLVLIAGLTYIYRFEGYPRSVFMADGIFTCFLCGGLRVLIRLYYNWRRQAGHIATASTPQVRARLLLVGAGDEAEKIIRETQDTASRYEVVCCLDDDRAKQGCLLHGVPIYGPIDRLPGFVLRSKAAEVLISLPNLPGSRILQIVELAEHSGIRCRTLPPLSSVIDEKVSVKNVRDVAVEDLLGRKPVKGDDTVVRAVLQAACVLVTGAGGSIGSELARQIARYRPRRLVLFEIGESPLFEIHRELHALHPDLEIVPVIGDIRQEEVVQRVFDIHRPEFVYHAAAYKHVPLMEAHPDEAVVNNVRGTRYLAQAACRVKTRRFVMISSDKAVRPSSIMGVTKRLCELLIAALKGNDTSFIAVRFGNVLGSNGSVIPIFQKQIAAHGPITVTDPEMTRFFMTIPEAVHLVLRCSAMQEKQGLYVLEMGTPIRIMDLARNMIRLSGLREGVDIAIKITGLRPGEKLHEELITYGEGLQKTAVDKINTLEQTMLPIAPTVFLAIVRQLEQVALSHDTVRTRTLLKQIIALDQEVHEHQGHGASDAVLRDIQQRGADEAAPVDSTGKELPPSQRLLLVDDDLFIRKTLGPALSRLGYSVDFSDSKQDALARIVAPGTDYDVILCDLYLPDGTGLEIMSEYRKLQNKAPFILMTGYDSPHLDGILGSGTEPPMLFKPFRIQDLVTIIESETSQENGLYTLPGQSGQQPATLRTQPGSSGGLTASSSQARPPPMPDVNPRKDDGRTSIATSGVPPPSLPLSITADQAPSQAGGKMKILIVDDSEAIRSRLVRQLKTIAGIEIVGQAETAAQAIAALRQFKPDAMTLDLRLKDGNGLNVLRLVQNEQLPTAVIVFTSYPHLQYEKRAQAAGAYAFLNKARDFAKISDLLRALMAGRHGTLPQVAACARAGCVAPVQRLPLTVGAPR